MQKYNNCGKYATNRRSQMTGATQKTGYKPFKFMCGAGGFMLRRTIIIAYI
jgi:hypothetical protein